MKIKELKTVIEALLFVSQKPLKTSKIFSILAEDELSIDMVKEALVELQKDKATPDSAIALSNIAGGWQFRTKPQYARYIQKLDGMKTLKLSKSALEVLAIIAYNQPTTKSFVQDIRGVDSSHIFKQLLDKGFIKIDGRDTKTAGSPLLYTTTKFFLEYFGINDLEELPSLKEAIDMSITGIDTDVKLELLNNMQKMKELNFADDTIIQEHEKLMNELSKALKNG